MSQRSRIEYSMLNIATGVGGYALSVILSLINRDDFACYPPEYFCPKSFQTGMLKLTKNTFSIHQFDASWYSEEEQEQKKKYWRDAQIDYWLHLPHRIGRKLLGDELYEKIKRLFGK